MLKKTFLFILLCIIPSTYPVNLNKSSIELAQVAVKFFKELFKKAVIETAEEITAKEIKKQAKKL